MEKQILSFCQSLHAIENFQENFQLSQNLKNALLESNNIDDFIRKTKDFAPNYLVNLEKQKNTNLLVINNELVIDFNRLKVIDLVEFLFLGLIFFKVNKNQWKYTDDVINGKISILSNLISSNGERLCLESFKNESEDLFRSTFKDTFKKLEFNFEETFPSLTYYEKDRLHGFIRGTIYNEIRDEKSRIKNKNILEKYSTFAIKMYQINQEQKRSFVDFIAYFEFASAIMKNKKINEIRNTENTDFNPKLEARYLEIAMKIKNFLHKKINYDFLDPCSQTFKSAIAKCSLQFDTIPLWIYHTCKHHKEMNPNDYVKKANEIIKNTKLKNIHSNILQYGNGRRFIFYPSDKKEHPFVVVISQATSRQAILATYH